MEKRICSKLEGTLSTLKLVNAFTFEFPSESGASLGNSTKNGKKERQYYFIFESYS